jgi:hypothetical protein
METSYEASIHLVFIINRDLTLKEPIDDIVILNFVQNVYPPNVQIR